MRSRVAGGQNKSLLKQLSQFQVELADSPYQAAADYNII